MKDLAIFILQHIVDLPDSVSVEESLSDTGTTILTIKVDKSDMGKVIGKNGNTIRAIRNCISILALKQYKYTDVVVAE